MTAKSAFQGDEEDARQPTSNAPAPTENGPWRRSPGPNHDKSTYPARVALDACAPVTNVVIKLLPLTLAVFIGFLVIGMQLPVLPLHLHDTLGMDTLVVGLVVGSQFAAALLSRSWAGNYADMRGAKRAVVAGSVAAAASGLLYLASLAFLDAPTTSVWILVAGRILLAMGESLIVTGAMGWGIGLVGPQNAGKVMAWNGIAMYGAYALGAPAGVVVNGLWGFNGISVATLFVPMLALAVVAGVRGIAPTSQRRTPFYKVLSAVWAPGMGLALSSVGFGVITAFIALLFAARIGAMPRWPSPRSAWPSSAPACSSAICPTRSAAPRSRWCA